MQKSGFINYIQELLEPYGISKIRPMFGGFGVYKDDVMVALIAYNELYFKADNESAKIFQSFGSTPFIYEHNNKTIKMSYWKVLPEILEDPSLLEKWYELAYNSAIVARKKIHQRKKKIK